MQPNCLTSNSPFLNSSHPFIPYGRQHITDDCVEAVIEVLRSDFLTSGPQVEAFEREFAEFIGAKHAVAVCNATAALHLAMRVLGIGTGDRVITSPITFVASGNAAAYEGGIPDFCDVDRFSANVEPSSLESSWLPDTKAVVAVDYGGVPCNMPEIARIARAHGAYVIEDACHGVGGTFTMDDKKWNLGAHPWADITTFSFHPVKTITTGEGGMLVTDNEEWAAKARLLRSHGITRNTSDFTGLTDAPSSPSYILSTEAAESAQCSTRRQHALLSEQGPWYYEMQELGYNYRITELQCALGRSQLKHLPEFIARRQKIASRYNQAFKTHEWIRPPDLDSTSLPDTHHLLPVTPTDSKALDARRLPLDSNFSYHLPDLSLHLYTLQLDFPRLGKTRTEVMQELKEQGIGTQVLYIPVYLQPWYRRTYGYSQGKCPNAETFYSRSLSLPLYPAMSDADVEKVIAAIIRVCLAMPQ